MSRCYRCDNPFTTPDVPDFVVEVSTLSDVLITLSLCKDCGNLVILVATCGTTQVVFARVPPDDNPAMSLAVFDEMLERVDHRIQACDELLALTEESNDDATS